MKRADHQLQHKRDRGFTFVEVVIVVLILGIMTTLALPAMNDFLRDETINAATDAVVTAIYFARTSAITTGVDHRVLFDTEADCFQVEKHVSGVPPEEVFEAVQNPLTKRDYLLSFDDGPIGQGVDLYGPQFGENSYVRFNNLGVPLEVGFFYLEYGGRTWKIGVTATSCEISS